MRGTSSIAWDVMPASRSSVTTSGTWPVGRNEIVVVPARSRRTPSTSSGLHGDDHVGRLEGVGLDGRAGFLELLVADQGAGTGAGLDRDGVPEPGQLPDQLGHHRDPGLPVAGLPGYSDLHSLQPSTTGVGAAASGAAEVGGGMLKSSEPATSATAVRVVVRRRGRERRSHGLRSSPCERAGRKRVTTVTFAVIAP